MKGLIKETVSRKLNIVLDGAIFELHKEFETRSGDITPFQEVRYERALSTIIEVLTDQINQNL